MKLQKNKNSRGNTAKSLVAYSEPKTAGITPLEIESLESRILLSSIFVLGANKQVSYHDADGDLVTIQTQNSAAAIYYDNLGGGRADVSQILVGSDNGSVGVFVKPQLIEPGSNVRPAEYSNGFTTIGTITAAVAGQNLTVDTALGEKITTAGGANLGSSVAITSTVNNFNRVVLDAAVINHVDFTGANLNSITLGTGLTQAWDNYYANISQIGVPATSSLANVVLNDVTADSVGLLKINGATSALTAPLFGIIPNGPVNNFNGTYDIGTGTSTDITRFEGLKSSFNGVFDGDNVYFKLNATGVAPNGLGNVQPPSVYATGDVYLDVGANGIVGGTFIAGDDLFIKSTGGLSGGGSFQAGDAIAGLDGGRILLGGGANGAFTQTANFLAGGDIADVFAPTARLAGSFTSQNGDIGAITAQAFAGVTITAPNGDIGVLTQLDSSAAFNANVTTGGDLNAIIAPGGIQGSYNVGGDFLTDAFGRSIVAGGEVSAQFNVAGTVGDVEITINNPATASNAAFSGNIVAGSVGDFDIEVNVSGIDGISGFVQTTNGDIGDVDILMGNLADSTGFSGTFDSQGTIGDITVVVLGQNGGTGISGNLFANDGIGAVDVFSNSTSAFAIDGANFDADNDGDFMGALASVTVASKLGGIVDSNFFGSSLGPIEVTNTGTSDGIYDSTFGATKGDIASVKVTSAAGFGIGGFFGSNFTGESIGNVEVTSKFIALENSSFTATEGSLGEFKLTSTESFAVDSATLTAKNDIGAITASGKIDGYAVDNLTVLADSDGNKAGNLGAITVENLATVGANAGAVVSSTFGGWQIGEFKATSNSLESVVTTVEATAIGVNLASKIGSITVENKSTAVGASAAINNMAIGNIQETVSIGSITTMSGGATPIPAGSATDIDLRSKVDGSLGNVTVAGNLEFDGSSFADNLATVGTFTVGGTFTSVFAVGTAATVTSNIGLITIGAAAGNAATFDFDNYNGAPNDAIIGGVGYNAPVANAGGSGITLA